ncbi:PKS-NRPS hybrid synthetase [Glycine max]|nr:PKS-NRPS hybrid synthetase [Glycine max]
MYVSKWWSWRWLVWLLTAEMDKDHWMHDNIMSEKVDMNVENEDEPDSNYKTNRYRLLLLDIAGVTSTGMTFSVAFAYLEGECLNNVVWALERFRVLFLIRDALPGVIVTDKDLTLMNAVKTVFPECTNLLCWFHIDKNLKAKCKSLIVVEYERVSYAGIDSSHYGSVMRTTHGLPCACELARYVVGSMPLGVIHMFWRRLSFSDHGLFKPEVSITEEMETISKWFEELDVCGKVTLKSKLREIAYPNLKSMCAPPKKVKTKGAHKKLMTKHQRSIKRDPSYWEYDN